MTTTVKKLIPHCHFPLRKIVRRETQNGQPVVVMVCGHAVLGKPESRHSRFFPCHHCHEVVERIRAEQSPDRGSACDPRDSDVMAG